MMQGGELRRAPLRARPHRRLQSRLQLLRRGHRARLPAEKVGGVGSPSSSGAARRSTAARRGHRSAGARYAMNYVWATFFRRPFTRDWAGLPRHRRRPARRPAAAGRGGPARQFDLRRLVALSRSRRPPETPWTASRGVEGWDQNITRPRAWRSLPCRPSPRPGCGSPRPSAGAAGCRRSRRTRTPPPGPPHGCGNGRGGRAPS